MGESHGCELSDTIVELVKTTEQPVIVFLLNGELHIGVLDSQPDKVEWYFSPVELVAIADLGARELAEV
jgi:hypothetical protein